MTDLTVDLNCDMGEGYGRWQMGQDELLVHHVSTVSVATGYHAGDPPTIRRAVTAAVQAGCQVGAHIAFPDLMGFGRRAMQIAPRDLQDYCLYQIGAIEGFVRSAGGRLGHVKPHGALYVMASTDPEVTHAVASAVAEIDPGIPLFLLNDTCAAAAAAAGVTIAKEGFPDINYSPTGSLIIEAQKQAWDPDHVAGRALRMVMEHKVASTEPGVDINLDVTTLCIHGDAPNAVDIARRTRAVLTDAGIRIASLNRP